jgi:tRNA 2-selenouridine synthase
MSISYQSFEQTSNWQDTSWDAIIDVRSPREFALDHIPNSINLPVLYDDEHQLVGRLHKTLGSFEAKVHGAHLVCKNIAEHIDQFWAKKQRRFRPLIYCARGGQRSASMATILGRIGWRVHVLKGGYKHFRKDIVGELETLPQRFRWIVLQGKTGSAKTLVLQALAAVGAQIIDLEDLANHRGSLLGQYPGTNQPKQRFFESRIHHSLVSYKQEQEIYVEAESSKVGNLHLPKSIWEAMSDAQRIEIEVPASERVRYLVESYQYLTTNPELFSPLFETMNRRHGHGAAHTCYDLRRAQNWTALARELLKVHYDPAYERTTKRRDTKNIMSFDLSSIGDDAIHRLALEIVQNAPSAVKQV